MLYCALCVPAEFDTILRSFSQGDTNFLEDREDNVELGSVTTTTNTLSFTIGTTSMTANTANTSNTTSSIPNTTAVAPEVMLTASMVESEYVAESSDDDAFAAVADPLEQNVGSIYR